MSGYKKIFFSFGNWPYYKSLQKLKDSVEKKGRIDSIFLFKDSDIEADFYKEHIKLFCDGRGFGYWVWKPYFIKKFFDDSNIKDDSVFLYVDAGNEVLDDLTPLYDICYNDKKGVVLFENTQTLHNNLGVWKNNLFTKSDCFNLTGLKTQECVYGDHVNAAYILFKKTDFSLMFFNKFFEFCKNYNIVSDASNITENFNKDFKEHKHDQSILSLLSNYYKITVIRSPSQYGNHRIKESDGYNQLFDHHRLKYYLDYTYCADEGETYELNKLSDVAFGYKGRFNYLYNKIGRITFNNETFGDPCPKQKKMGYYKVVGENYDKK